MRKRVTKLLSVLFITSSLLVALFPFYIVKAENATYFPITSNGTYTIATNIGGSGTQSIEISNYTSEIRCFYWLNPSYNGWPSFYFVSQGSFTYKFTGYSTGSITNAASYNWNGQYYIASMAIANTTFNSDLPNNPYKSDLGADNRSAIYYTFGAGAVDPVPEPVYGDLILNGYSTDIAGQGEASINNIDHILWNNSIDTNGNDISNCKVRIRLIPGSYSANTKADLIDKVYTDFVLDTLHATDHVFNVSDGEANFLWSDVIDELNLPFFSLYSLAKENDAWLKKGWIYQIRLEDEDNDFIGDWQTVYSSTSSGVSNDLTIINNTTIDQNFIKVLQEVNSLNTVTNNWMVNNIEISVTNEYTEPQQNEKPWWAYLLESILNTFNITNNYIYEGDSNTQNITNTVNDSDDNMNQKINEYQQYEDDFIQDMDDNLTDIDTDVPLLSNNKFINSANWVAQQYNRMTNNTVIGSLLGFSLVFGLALIFIGRIR